MTWGSGKRTKSGAISYKAKPKRYNPDDPFEKVFVFLPKGTHRILKEASADLQVPVSRLIALALDNELDCQPQFNYPCVLPEEYIPHAYAEEAALITAFLAKIPQGASRDTIMLCRRDIGISSRVKLMHGLKELFEQGLAEEVKPTKTNFNYAKGYTRVRLKDAPQAVYGRSRYRRVEGVTTVMQRRIQDEDVE